MKQGEDHVTSELFKRRGRPPTKAGDGKPAARKVRRSAPAPGLTLQLGDELLAALGRLAARAGIRPCDAAEQLIRQGIERAGGEAPGAQCSFLD